MIINQKLNFMNLIGRWLKLKTSHNYYFQIQGQLHITKRQCSFFVVWMHNYYYIIIIV